MQNPPHDPGSALAIRTHYRQSESRAARLRHGKAKTYVQAKVEHPFLMIKRQFGYEKVHFLNLSKNTALMVMLFALPNLWMARRHSLVNKARVIREMGTERRLAEDKGPARTMRIARISTYMVFERADGSTTRKLPAISEHHEGQSAKIWQK
jgi:hypothetical protein